MEQRKVKQMILPIARVLLLSSILGGFAVSASFAQGTQGGQGEGGQMQGGGAGGGAGGGQVIPPPGTPKSGTSQEHKQKQQQTQGEQGQSQTMERKRHRGQQGEGEQASNKKGGGEMESRRGDHERRHSREGRFRYYHGGFWYAEPWWTVGVVVNDRHVRWCRHHYPTYRASTNTFITPSGRPRVCISPFS
jgi:hypothetical protein